MPGTELQPYGQADLGQKIAEILRGLVSEVPSSSELTSLHPKARAKHLTDAAAIKAAAVAGTLAIVPGPLGILTIIPALVEIWRIQRQLVSDIAGCYGQSANLTPTIMVYCLFRHGSATVFKETVVQLGGRMLVKQASLRVFQKIIEKVSINVTQRVIGQFISRWLPLLGSAAIAAYTYRDTRKIGENAITAFEREIEAEFVVIEGHVPTR